MKILRDLFNLTCPFQEQAGSHANVTHRGILRIKMWSCLGYMVVT